MTVDIALVAVKSCFFLVVGSSHKVGITFMMIWGADDAHENNHAENDKAEHNTFLDVVVRWTGMLSDDGVCDVAGSGLLLLRHGVLFCFVSS